MKIGKDNVFFLEVYTFLGTKADWVEEVEIEFFLH